MAVRNCAEIGENLQIIITRLMANDNLVKLLYYTDKDPLSKNNLSSTDKTNYIFDKLIKITPKITAKETANSIISIKVKDGIKTSGNDEFRNIKVSIETIVPLEQFCFKSTNLRPFAIMGEIQKSLDEKTINGLGKMRGGDFNLEFITEDVICYEQIFSLVTYD